MDMVGRASEVAAITHFIELVPSGPVRLSIDGEPGIGKTMLWSEAVRTGVPLPTMRWVASGQDLSPLPD